MGARDGCGDLAAEDGRFDLGPAGAQVTEGVGSVLSSCACRTTRTCGAGRCVMGLPASVAPTGLSH